MNIWSRFRKKPKTTNVVIDITELGNRKLEKPGVAEYQFIVLDYLHNNGASSIEEISREEGIDMQVVRSTCRDLVKKGHIRRVAGKELV